MVQIVAMKKKSLNGIRAAGAELGDEHAGEGGAGAPRGVEDNGVETDGIGQIIGRHSIGDQGGPCHCRKVWTTAIKTAVT